MSPEAQLAGAAARHALNKDDGGLEGPPPARHLGGAKAADRNYLFGLDNDVTSEAARSS